MNEWTDGRTLTHTHTPIIRTNKMLSTCGFEYKHAIISSTTKCKEFRTRNIRIAYNFEITICANECTVRLLAITETLRHCRMPYESWIKSQLTTQLPIHIVYAMPDPYVCSMWACLFVCFELSGCSVHMPGVCLCVCIRVCVRALYGRALCSALTIWLFSFIDKLLSSCHVYLLEHLSSYCLRSWHP